MELSGLRLLCVACVLLISCAELREKGTSSEAWSKPSPLSEEAAAEAWEEDEACSGEDSEQCVLSLRQLRGRAKKQEVEEHRQEARGGSGGAVGQEPTSTILGVPLYLHPEDSFGDGDELEASMTPRRPRRGTSGRKTWIVTLVQSDDLGGDSNGNSGAWHPVKYVSGSHEDLAQELSRTAGVAFVEEDTALQAVPELDAGEENDWKESLGAGPDDEAGDDENPPASWGLDRIDAKDGLDHWYEHAGYGGAGAHVYMLDTGINTLHQDFGGRAVPTIEVDMDGLHECNATNASCALDTLGHGTHTAGTVGGHRYGVAKGATLHACKTLDNRGSGMISWMVMALEWVVNNGQRPALISASLGGHYDSPSLTNGIDRAVKWGVTVVVAAGNENDDACNYMPSKVPSAITVGATAVGDSRAPYSNYGKCLDIFAPGSAITSAGVKSDTATQKLSGTSMACPHVAGAVALLLAQDPNRSPEDVRNLLVTEASVDKVLDAAGSPNLLLYTEPPKPRPAPLELPSRFEVYDGPCEVDASGCVSTKGFPKTGYGNSEQCDILIHGDVGHVHVDAFDTERSFDTLIANFHRYSGTLQRGNAKLLECVQPKGALTWTSDRTDSSGGWRLCPELKPTAEVNATPGFFVACGSCTRDTAGCVTSPNYPMNYTGHEVCYIDITGDVAAIEVEDFATEASYDMLWVNGQNYSGTEGPDGIRPSGQLVWSSDTDLENRGWKLCPGASK